jgi:hypothetical protein
MDKLASSDRRAGAIFRVTDDEMRVNVRSINRIPVNP